MFMDHNPTSHVATSPTPDSQASSNVTAGGSEGGGSEFERRDDQRQRLSKLHAQELSPAPAGEQVRRRRRTECVADSHAPPCTECGRRFGSWKALFGHMRCHPERGWRGINPPDNSLAPATSTEMKGSSSKKLTKSAKPKEEEREVAECLMMLSKGRRAELHHKMCHGSPEEAGEASTSTSNSRFQCSSCKKVFNSRQALGGHRASHRNVKGCFARACDVLSVGDGKGEAKACHGWDLNLPASMEDVQDPSSEISLELSLGFSSRM